MRCSLMRNPGDCFATRISTSLKRRAGWLIRFPDDSSGKRISRFRRSESGLASVEFALLSTFMLTLFAGAFDLAYMVSAKRDADRASMLVARAMVSCPNSSCMSDLIYKYLQREVNLLVRYPTATIDLYMIQRQNGAVTTCSGTQKTLTDSDVLASALNVMKDGDVGAAVILTTTYTPILPKAVLTYINASGATYRDYTVDVMKNLGTSTSLC